ncbi:MAG: hypothetical protein RL189_3267 [Pseudomonadota bacterium]
MKLQLKLLFLVAGGAVGCAPDVPTPRTAVTIGCVGKQASNPNCRAVASSNDDQSGKQKEEPRDPGATPPATQPVGENQPVVQPPVQQPPAAQPAPAPQPNPFEQIIGIIDKIGKGNGLGNSGPGNGTPDSGNGDAQQGGAENNPPQPPPPPSSSSVSLTTKSGTYIKKQPTSIGSTWVDGKDYCLIPSGTTFTAQCVADDGTHYKLKGASACSGLSVSYILKSGLNTPSRVSSSCP